RRAAPEVSAGLAVRGSAGHAVRSQQHPGREARRQRRPHFGDLGMQNSEFRMQTPRRSRARVPCLNFIAASVAAASIALAAETTVVDAAERGDRASVLRLLAKGANPNTPGPD